MAKLVWALGASAEVFDVFKPLVQSVPKPALYRLHVGGDAAAAICDSLRNMAANISSVGMNVVMFDQVTSYFLYLYPKPTLAVVDPEDFESELTNLIEIVQLRDGELH